MTQAEWQAEGARRFGPKPRAWKFVCPMCGTVQSIQQLLDVCASQDEVHAVMGYSCIGRFTGAGDDGIAAKNRGEVWTKGCNWTLGGLLQVHTLEVLTDGGPRPTFEFAPAEVPS